MHSDTYLEDGGAVMAAWHRVAEEESAPKALRVKRRTPVRMMLEEGVRLLLCDVEQSGDDDASPSRESRLPAFAGALLAQPAAWQQ